VPIMISRRKLESGDFDAWKVRFEAGASMRKEAGCRGVRRFRNVNDPDELIVLFDWDSHENARRFAEMKISENSKLVEERSPGGSPKLENIFVEEMEPLSN
jgi:heme-degrading monooxygenase HmoA